jgi:hypothetical protein
MADDTFEQGWVIEHAGSESYAPVYLCLQEGQVSWSPDNLAAFRMSREVDAMAFRKAFLAGDKHRIASHGWG